MMMEHAHATDETIALFLAGELDATRDDELRTHLRECASCADKLHGEAALSHELWRLRQSARPCPGCARLVAPAQPSRCGHCGAAVEAGGFRVVRVIAEHDHGRMYEAVAADGSRVALKELVFARIPDVETLRALEREGETLRALDLGSTLAGRVPRFVASFTEGEGVHLRCYLAQELVSGRSLSELIEARRFDEDEVRTIGESVLETLVALQRGSPPLLHRDIKPANLIVRDDGSIVVVDFGSARTTKATMNASVVGTFGYMPAEQLAGLVDTSTDVHAVGATLVHLLTRRPPWEVLHDRWQQRVHASPALLLVLEQMLAPAGQRYRDAAEALAALRSSRYRHMAPPRPPSRHAGPMLLAAAAAGVVVALLAVLALVLVRTSPGEAVAAEVSAVPAPPMPLVPPVPPRDPPPIGEVPPPGRTLTQAFTLDVDGLPIGVRTFRSWSGGPTPDTQTPWLTVELALRDDTRDEIALQRCWTSLAARVLVEVGNTQLRPFVPPSCTQDEGGTAARAQYAVPLGARSLALRIGGARVALATDLAALLGGVRGGGGDVAVPPLPRQSDGAVLALGTSPFAATTLDGKPMGTTPFYGSRSLHLSVGRHRLTFDDPAKARRVIVDIEVLADDPGNSLIVTLAGEPAVRIRGMVQLRRVFEKAVP